MAGGVLATALAAAAITVPTVGAAFSALTANAGSSWGAATTFFTMLGAGETTAGQVGTVDLTRWYTPQATSLTSTSPAVTSLTGSNGNGCAVLGTLWCWGRNNAYYLGLGDVVTRRAPTRVGSATNWASASMSTTHGCATRTDGTLWCWADNSSGQQGTSTPSQRSTPTQVGALTTWAQVTTGNAFTCARKTDATLWCAGNNGQGQGGNGSTSPATQTAFTQVGALTTWTGVDAGTSHLCGTRTDGTVWCWGDNTSGQIGNGTSGGSAVTSPTKVGTATDWAQVSAGGSTTCGVKTGGTLWCWGDNSLGQAGTGSAGGTVLSATQVGSATNWASVSVGNQHACALRTNGTLWCWGSGGSGRLGLGSTADAASPTQVGTGTAWTIVDAGYTNSCGTQTNGTVYCWGSSATHANGAGIGQDTFGGFVGGPWSQVELGDTGGCAIRSDQTLWCWGTNLNGQVGVGDSVMRSVPTQVGSATWSKVEQGTAHTCGIRTNGTMWCWGVNTAGQLGQGNTSPSSVPVQVGSATDWVALSADVATTCGIRTGGTMWCWGSNATGQQGTGGTAASVTSPQAAAGGTAVWSQVAVGAHACGIRTNGTLWCWGANSSGQVGNGGITQQNSPVQIGAATDWTRIAIATASTCGIRSTGGGTLYCWGGNGSGQLGMGAGDTTTRYSPTIVPGSLTWSTVDVGGATTCAVRTTGALRCWGANTNGQLGDGTLTSHGDTGSDVAGVSGATQTSVGSVASAVLTP